MKTKTITTHVVMLNNNEARLIYYALRYYEAQEDALDAVGVNKEKLRKLKDSFYKLVRIRKQTTEEEEMD